MCVRTHDRDIKATIMKNLFIFLAAMVMALAIPANAADDFVLGSQSGQSAVIYVDSNEPGCVQKAVADLVSDVNKITGITLQTTSKASSKVTTLYVGTLTNSAFKKQVKKLIDCSAIEGKWESYIIKTVSESQMVIAGSDERGTMWGVYELLEEYLGVDPMYWWSDVQPTKQEEIALSVDVTSEEPTFKYRGWFINDEDMLTEWVSEDNVSRDLTGMRGRQDYNIYYYKVIDHSVYARIFEAMVRMKYNLVIPASYINILRPYEAEIVQMAADRGLFITQHHCEPVGVSAFNYFNYWKEKDGSEPVYSYFSEKEKLMEVWDKYISEWAKYPNVVWQIGLRGIADSPMWMADKNAPSNNEERAAIINNALRDEVEIIKKYDKRSEIPKTWTLWGEGAVFNEQGLLDLPENTMMIFADNGPGWRFQNDFYKTERKEGIDYGVYYHHQIWVNGPHLMPGVPPSQSKKVLGEAVRLGSNSYAILNVGNVREYVYGVKASADILFDFDSVPADGGIGKINNFYYGSNEEIAEIYDDYYGSFEIGDTAPVPILLDGLCRIDGGQMLREIEQIITDSTAFYTRQAQNAYARDPFMVSLSDMWPPHTTEEVSRRGKTQAAGFRSVIARAEALLPTLEGQTKNFFETNLLSHAYLMLGMTEYAVYTADARLALDRGDYEDCLQNLRLAGAALDYTQRFKLINSKGEKWRDYYRSETKINLDKMKADFGRYVLLVEDHIAGR